MGLLAGKNFNDEDSHSENDIVQQLLSQVDDAIEEMEKERTRSDYKTWDEIEDEE